MGMAMDRTGMKITAALLALAAAGSAGAALAQARDPAYAAARAAGQVGEQPDGYLGVVGNASADVRKMVSDINLQRKKAYTTQAQAEGGTVEQRGFVTGCNLIARTTPGEKYMDPAGAWQTRGAGAPVRDPKCI
ncbi:YdbL family protein [Sphingomonas sp. BGYR3]|uniref:YdbL family protein n=1 Tax=Sphingomonas sp. BGYR3 TaxID=2975483 RepID=UPI0021A42D6B|nr:YdbL family protein [Sphingomonas sp. BGYR3]MDG5489313.1 YdbL family protein [Sphingomonas sp. BGYR3]